jgi:tetratricopeptide (TPR) repeat protein
MATLRCISLATIFIMFLTTCGVSVAANSQTWIEVRSPNFIVVTNANDKQAQRVAYQFELIRSVFREYFGKTGPSTDPPITIIAAKDEGTLKALLLEFWAKKGSMHPAGMFLGSADANYVVLRLDISLNESAYEPYEPVYHEYVHYLTRHLRSQLPLWMVEGLAEFYGNTRIESDRVLVGAPSTSNLKLLRQTQLLPINTLFDVDASSPYYHEESKTSIFYAESWALTHYLMARDWNEKTNHVTLFVTLLGKGVNQREAARLTIGDPGSLEPVLRQYVQSHLFTAVRQDPPKIDESGFQARRMSDAESLAVRADFMAHDHHYQEAQQMLDEALKEDPKLGAACESMSSLYLAQGNFAEASKWASQAMNLNPQSFRANYYVALTLIASGVRDEQTLSKAESSLRTVLKSNAEFTPAYDLLAYVLSQPGPTQKLDEAYMATVEAVSREPGNVRYRIRAVEVQKKRGRAEDAIRVAELAIPLAKTPADKAIAEASLAAAKQFSKNPLMSPLVEDVWQKLNENLSKDNSAKTDLEHDVAALTKLLDAGSLDAADDSAARYFRASAQTLLNVFHNKDGLSPDTAVNEQYLGDLDRIIAGKTDITAWGITMSNVAYTAGTIAWNGLHSPRTYSYWQLCVETVPCMVNLASGYTLGWEGVKPDPAKALELDLKAFDTGTRYRCAGAYAANNIAGLIYFAGVSYPKDTDPVSWIQKSYALSDPIEAQPNSENACGGAGAHMDEFLYRLAQGDRRNNLLTEAVQRFSDKATTAPALAKYFSGSIDANAFQAAVESSKSEFGRCYAYFHAMWYAFIAGDTPLVNKFYEPLSKFDQATCHYYLVYAEKFHPEATQSQSIPTQHSQ